MGRAFALILLLVAGVYAQLQPGQLAYSGANFQQSTDAAALGYVSIPVTMTPQTDTLRVVNQVGVAVIVSVAGESFGQIAAGATSAYQQINHPQPPATLAIDVYFANGTVMWRANAASEATPDRVVTLNVFATGAAQLYTQTVTYTRYRCAFQDFSGYLYHSAYAFPIWPTFTCVLPREIIPAYLQVSLVSVLRQSGEPYVSEIAFSAPAQAPVFLLNPYVLSTTAPGGATITPGEYLSIEGAFNPNATYKCGFSNVRFLSLCLPLCVSVCLFLLCFCLIPLCVRSPARLCTRTTITPRPRFPAILSAKCPMQRMTIFGTKKRFRFAFMRCALLLCRSVCLCLRLFVPLTLCVHAQTTFSQTDPVRVAQFPPSAPLPSFKFVATPPYNPDQPLSNYAIAGLVGMLSPPLCLSVSPSASVSPCVLQCSVCSLPPFP